MANPPLSTEQQRSLRAYRRQLWLLMALSSGLDLLTSVPSLSFMAPTFGGSLLLDEAVEYLVSKLLARNRLRLHPVYKVAGFIPVPGVTALSLQVVRELYRLRRQPTQALARLEAISEA